MTADAAPSSRRSWMVVIPLLAVIALAIVWSILWTYAANRAEREIDNWIKREASFGRMWSCSGDRSIGGYPFRFELLCDKPTLETRGGDPMRVTAAQVHAVAQVWAPNHIVAEFKSPGRVQDLATGDNYGATWKLLQMSGVGNLSGRPERFSLAAEEPQVDRPGEPGFGPRLLGNAKYVEFHLRRSPTANGSRDGADYAAGIKGGESPLLALIGASGPLDLTLQGNVSQVDDMRPMPVEQRLREWAMAGGTAKLDRFVVSTPQVTATAEGQVSATAQGLLNGSLKLGFAGLEDAMRGLAQSGALPEDLASIVGALAMVGSQGQVEGKKGVTFALGLKEGVLRLGPVPVGYVPPLF